jgi:hypothetical protein
MKGFKIADFSIVRIIRACGCACLWDVLSRRHCTAVNRRSWLSEHYYHGPRRRRRDRVGVSAPMWLVFSDMTAYVICTSSSNAACRTPWAIVLVQACFGSIATTNICNVPYQASRVRTILPRGDNPVARAEYVWKKNLPPALSSNQGWCIISHVSPGLSLLSHYTHTYI